MPHSPCPYISHHVFNLQGLAHQSPLVQSTFNINDIHFFEIAMLDSGCSTCIIPISQLPGVVKKYMIYTDIQVKGMNGSIAALSKLTCNVTIGNQNSRTFEKVNVLMTIQATPILIGQNVLRHNTLSSCLTDIQDSTVEHTQPLSHHRYQSMILCMTSNPL